MSLITQCPACTTLFKVVQDQLRISEGWVRCGQCDEVFDANAHLQFLGEAQAAPDDQHKGRPHDESTRPDIQTSFMLTVAAVLHEDGHEDVGEHVAAVEPKPKIARGASSGGLSFMEKSSHGGARGSAIAVMLWSLCLFLLAVLLCLQFVVQERDRLAAMEPELRPMLESLCGALGCELSHLRQIESVVIESSSFVNVQGSVYRLNATLKNTGPFAVELPAMELTLTDLQDQAVIRRVIAVSEFGSVSRALSAGGELQATFPLGVKLSNGSEKFSGYRLVIFYP